MSRILIDNWALESVFIEDEYGQYYTPVEINMHLFESLLLWIIYIIQTIEMQNAGKLHMKERKLLMK